MSGLIILAGYLLGSIPTAYIAGRIHSGKDIRRAGDGNIGAQNAFHQFGPATGVAVGIIDALKGALVIIAASAAGASLTVVLLTGVAAVAGHNWPVFLHFKGGRGMSVTMGIFSVLITLPFIIAGVAAVAVLLKTKSVIKTSAVLFISVPVLCWWLGVAPALLIYSIVLPCLVGFTHFTRTRQGLARPV
ncbi:MAG: glycerol-3-phosphate acyltransferase [Dehalococcoidaceae bacterium]|nr:glycerol-3-phosphate acyltransferase [Dehalococcoidaceae bacterium]